MKILTTLVMLWVGVAVWLSPTAMADASGSTGNSGVIISRVDTTNGSEYIQIFNGTGVDIDFDTLHIKWFNTATTSREFLSQNKRLAANGLVLIKQGGITTGDKKNSDGYWAASVDILTPNGGRIILTIDDEEVTNTCWGSVANNSNTNADCTDVISIVGAVYTSQNCLENAICGAFGAESKFGGIIDRPRPETPIYPQYCSALRLSEISTNDQWIEIYNDSDFTISSENLEDCTLAVQYGDSLPMNFNRYKLDLGQHIGANIIASYSYFVIDIATADGLSLPKSVKDRTIVIIDTEHEYDDAMYSSQKANTTLALFADGWKVTYAPTPGEENIYQRWQTCEVGKHINEATGNCVKDPEPPVECAEGQFRNPETGRCKKIATEPVLAECAEGQFRNPLTNRCKKIATEDDLVPCAEGWERNPETNRCRKIVSTFDAQYAIDPVVGNSSSSEMWIWIGAGGLAFVGGLMAWQFHSEIGRFFRRLFRR